MFGGEAPPADGSVYFAPSRPADGFPARGGYGSFKKHDGRFVVLGSAGKDDGLMPGSYRVTIRCWKTLSGENGSPGASFVPKGYSPPELRIGSDDSSPVEYDLDVPSPPP
jgi:hypothetical protein